jgi:hypothetical protein
MSSLPIPARPLLALAAASLCIIVPSAPAASQVRIGISGEVQPVCRVDARLTNGAGQVKELCNVPAGYDLYLDYAPQAAGAAVTIDGAALALSSAGSTLIASSSGPAIRTRAVSIAAPAGVADNRFAFRIVSR